MLLHQFVVNLVRYDVRDLIFALRVFFEMLGSFRGIAAGPAEETITSGALYVGTAARFMSYLDAALGVRAFACTELHVKLC